MTTWAHARHFVYEAIDDLPERDVAIVPGCGVRDGQPTLVLADRLHAALMLRRARKVERVLVSGNAAQVDVMREWLVSHGVSTDRVDLDPAGHRTLVTMRRAVRNLRITSAIVCTNRFHLRRAVYLARAEGIDAVGMVADRNVYASRHRNEAREVVARARAIFDVYVGRLTRDRRT